MFCLIILIVKYWSSFYMPKTVLINYTGRKGAGCIIAYESAKGFIENGITVIAIVSSSAENLKSWKDLKLKKLLIVDTYSTKKEFILNSFKLFFIGKYFFSEQLRNFDYDFIYCPMLCMWSGLINSKLKKKPIIVVNHDPIPHSDTSRLEANLYKRDCKKAKAVIVHSQKFVNYVREKYNKNTFYMPLCRHDSYKEIKEKKIIYKYNNKKQNFIFFGRISPYKGLNFLCEAYKKIENEFDNCHLIVAGNGDFSPYVKMYNELKSVSILNQWIADDEVESLFDCNSLTCVLPYVDATQSGVVLVAMDYGVPIIATNTGGLSEQIEDGITGLLVTPSDSDALYLAMKKIIEDKNIRNKIIVNQKKYIESLSWKNEMKLIEQIALGEYKNA